MAMPETMNTALTAPCGPKRIAAQRRKGKTTYAWRSRPGSLAVPPKTRSPKTASSPNKATASAMMKCRRGSRGRDDHTRSNGATTRSPSMSPNHQARSVGQIMAWGTAPPASRLKTPMVALKMVLKIAASRTSAATSWIRSNRGSKRTRRSSADPASASSVFPAPIANAAGKEAPAIRFTQAAPRRMPGHSRLPKRRSAASAMPVGGQTRVANPLTASSSRPNRAVTK
jgi:hypothetical protein